MIKSCNQERFGEESGSSRAELAKSAIKNIGSRRGAEHCDSRREIIAVS
jgi:hypothetical protein